MDLEVGGILGLIWLIIVIWAILKVAKSGAGTFAKVLWIPDRDIADKNHII